MSQQLYKTFYDVPKLTVWGDSIDSEGGKGRARLSFGFRDGNPRFIVNTGEATGGAGMIIFPMDFMTFGGVCEVIDRIIQAEPGAKCSITSLGVKYENDQPTKEKRLVATFYVGKTKEGVVYFSVISDDKPKLVFPLKTSPFHQWFGNDREQLSEAEVSAILAKGFVRNMSELASHALLVYTSEEYAAGGRKLGAIQVKDKKHGNDKTQIVDDLDSLGL